MFTNQLLELLPIGDPSRDGPGLKSWERVHMDPITAIMGGVGAASNIFGGLFGGSGAKKAADIQARAAEAARQHVEGTAAAVNPQIITAAENAGNRATNNADQAAIIAREAAARAGQGVTAAAGGANARLDPYANAGKTAIDRLNAGLGPGGEFGTAPTLSDLQMDPGYAFRTAEAQKAINASAASRGGAVSGATLKDLENYRQGAASQEYLNAFNRFRANRQDVFSNAFDVAGRGQLAATTQGGNEIDASKYSGTTDINATQFGEGLKDSAQKYAGTMAYQGASDTARNTINAAGAGAEYLTQGANAKAAGAVNSGTTLGNIFKGIGGSVNSALSLKQLMNLLKNPALTRPGTVIGPSADQGNY